MRFVVISLFPDIIVQAAHHSIIGRALNQQLITLECLSPRDFAEGPYRKVDDVPYGGGPGMVMMCAPILKAYESLGPLNPETTATLLMAANGHPLKQSHVQHWANTLETLVIICGHYEGIDARLIELILNCQPICVGDVVLTGGELPALTILDAVARLRPNVLGKAESLRQESFENDLLEYPQYTRPASYRGVEVPEVLLSGNHKAIEDWRKNQQLQITQQRRPLG